MVEGSQRRILQIWLFSTLPNPQTTRLGHYDVHWNSFSWIPHLPTFCSCCLVVDGTVDGKDNKEEKTREVAGSRMYRKNWNFLLLGFIELWIWWLVYESFYTFQHVWPHIKYSWWSPTQWTARRTWRRRPGGSVTLQYITSVEIFINQDVIWFVDVGWYENSLHVLSTCPTTLRQAEDQAGRWQ